MLRNPIFVLGILVTLVTGFFHFIMFLLDLSSRTSNPYLDMFYYVALPVFFFAGLALCWIGRRRHRRHVQKRAEGEDAEPEAPLSPSALTLAGLATVAVVAFASFSGYSAFHYTESVGFCGTSCHTPMAPTYAAYRTSPHQELACSTCHVGDGPRGFLEAKLSGTRQVIQTLTDTFHRPIHAPRAKLNVTREACTKCHVPENSSHFRLVQRNLIASDKANTFRPIFMALKTHPRRGLIQPRNFHWHESEIEYASPDERVSEIPWVRVRGKDGVKVYRSDGVTTTADPPGTVHQMHCIDCHNRVGHNYRSPDEILNELFSKGELDYTVPYLKQQAARLFTGTYADSATARSEISTQLRSYYETNFPEVVARRSEDFDQQLAVLETAYAANFFPEMRADWRRYPDHSAHKYSLGCFRCHDGKHVAADGSVISQDCTLCHSFYQEESQDGDKVYLQGKYKHPWNLEKADHANYTCSQCHRGGETPPADCIPCHTHLGLTPPPESK